jgi:xanthine/CO dehydrogenase XdhC/CoxF family maturation factor
MNERIRELMAEAVTFRLDPDSNAHEAQVCPEDLELFAELIVQECAQVCLAQRDPANLNYKPSERFAEAVKQHFGVEQ